MVQLLVEDNGKKRLKSDVDFVDEVIKLKNTRGQWAVIDKLIDRWIKSSPEETHALKIQLEDQREMLIDKEFGTTKGGKDMERRFTLVFPLRLQQMIRAVYSVEELNFDSKFYREFVEHYPQFRVAEKI